MSADPEVVPVLHPVPMRFLPRRGRYERMTYVQATSPVRLTRVDPETVAPVHPFEDRYGVTVGLAAIEGRPFVRAGAAMDPGAFAAYLLRSGRTQRTGALEYAFAGTPLSVRHTFSDASDADGYAHDSDFRGYVASVPGDAPVTYDGTAAARSALQGFFDQRVRLVGNDVYVDTGGPAFTRVWPRKGPSGSFRLAAFPNLSRFWDEDATGSCAPDEADALAGAAASSGAGGDGRAGTPIERRLLALLPPAGDTATMFANQAPGAVFLLIREALYSERRLLITDPVGRGQVARLRWLALEGSLGLIRPGDAGPAIAHVAAMAEWGLGRLRAQAQWERLGEVVRHCRERVLPRLADVALPIPGGDAAVLGELAP